jgi:hypothetical protein
MPNPMDEQQREDEAKQSDNSSILAPRVRVTSAMEAERPARVGRIAALAANARAALLGSARSANVPPALGTSAVRAPERVLQFVPAHQHDPGTDDRGDPLVPTLTNHASL